MNVLDGGAQNHDRLRVLTATYNERDHVREFHSRLRAAGVDAELVFVDDSSPDGTGAILDAIAREDPRVRVIHRPRKLGVGSAHLDGMMDAYHHGYGTLVTLDCDLTHPPELVPSFIERAPGADVVVGNRFAPGGEMRGWSLLRRALSRVGHMATTVLLGVPHDATGSFRLYRLSRIPRELFSYVESPGYAFFFESLLLLHDNRFVIRDLPLRLPDRACGNSKLTFLEAARSARRVIELGWLLRTRPGLRQLGERVRAR